MADRSNRVYPLIIIGVVVSLTICLAAGFFFTTRQRFIDPLFTSKDPRPSVIIVEIDETSIENVGQWPWPRKIFAQLIDSLAGARVIGIDVNFKEESRLGKQDDEALAQAISHSPVSAVVLTAEIQPDGSVSHPIIKSSAREGFPNILTDRDGVVRTTRFLRGELQSFALTIGKAYDASKNIIKVTPIQTRIDFAGKDRTYPMVSAKDVLDHKIPETFFKDKIVLIGATARDLQDYHQTPFGLTNGVEIQANSVATLLSQRFYESSDLTTGILIALLSVLTVSFNIGKRKRASALVLTGSLIVLYNLAAAILFDHYYILDILYPNVAIVSSALIAFFVKYRKTNQEKRFIQETFSHYLAPQVIEELIQDPSKLALGGKKEHLSILFSDIRGFTTLSESMDPEQLTQFLNLYLTLMTDIVLEGRGVVDKYIGDAIMAFWGAPLPNPHHARDAIEAAVDMIDALHNFNEENIKKGNPTINIGVGINSGEVTIGNMGSQKRFDYTVMGDNVNLASRLESLSKTYAVNIIISENTRNLVSESDSQLDHLLIREIDQVQVKGKKQGVTIFEVVPRYRQSQVEAIRNLFESARTLYYQGQWDQAIEVLEKILVELPDDGPSKLLLERCREFKIAPPEHWTGVYEMTHK